MTDAVTSQGTPGTGYAPVPRVLFVHAHPDDETITTGGTLATLVDAGAEVVLLTATRGEGGEVIGEDLAHLFGDRPALAAHRETELAAAMRVLGVTDHRFLGDGPAGGAGDGRPSRRFEDSGMVWGEDGHAHAPDDMSADALCAATVTEVAAYIRAVMDEVRPHLVITYASGGGYGHPDHRRVHEATLEAFRVYRAKGPAAAHARLLFVDTPAEVARDAFDPQAPGFDLTGFDAVTDIPTIPAEAPLAVAQDVDPVLGRKALAMAAHATQISISGHFFALSNGIGQKILDTEYFTDADHPGPAPAPWAPVDSVLAAIDPVAIEVERERPAAAGPAIAAGAVAPAAAGTEAPTTTARAVAPGTDLPAAVPGARTDSASTTEPLPKVGPAAWLHAVIVSVLIAVLGSLQHLGATVVHPGGTAVVLPWGLGISLLLAGLALWHVATLYRSTVLVVGVGALVSILSFVLGQPSLLPGHDLVVTGGLRSIVWLFGPMVLAGVFAFTLPSLKPPHRETTDDPKADRP